MKKLFLLLCVLNVLVFNSYFNTTPGCSVFAANTMTTVSWFFTIGDAIKPFIQNLTPAQGVTTAVNSNITFDICDNETGVNLPTVVVKANGTTLAYTSTPITNGYHVVTETVNFGYGQRVDISITAADLAP